MLKESLKIIRGKLASTLIDDPLNNKDMLSIKEKITDFKTAFLILAIFRKNTKKVPIF
jgi:hypothetical protein